MVGFPGETDGRFMELLDFLKEVKFERLGAFKYSREDGTKAAAFPDQVPEKVKEERFGEVMKLQRDISRENNLKLIGRKIRVLIDEGPGEGGGGFTGRSYMDAPEVDGAVYVKGPGIREGEFVDVNITGTTEYDLIGETL